MNTLAKPRLYLDVDNVLNARKAARKWRTEGDAPDSGYGRGFAISWDTGTGGGWNSYMPTQYRMVWSVKLIEALKALEKEHNVEIVWCTTWCDDAPKSVGPLMGLGASHRVLHPLNGVVSFPSIEWKLESVREDQLANPSPYIWIDDEVWDLGIDRLISSLPGGKDDRYLLIGPQGPWGITPQNMKEIHSFLEGLENNVDDTES